MSERINDSDIPQLIAGLRKRGRDQIVTVSVESGRKGFNDYKFYRAEAIGDLIHRLSQVNPEKE